MRQPGCAPHDDRMPNRAPSPVRRLVALRLALRLTAGVFSSTGFTFEHQPFGDAFEAMEWLRGQLAPLARHDRHLRDLLCIIDPEQGTAPWSSPRGTKQELLRLAAQAQALGRVKRQSRR